MPGSDARARRVLYVAPTGIGKRCCSRPSPLAWRPRASGPSSSCTAGSWSARRPRSSRASASPAATSSPARPRTSSRRSPSPRCRRCPPSALVLEYDLVVIDEAHHAVAGTWSKVLERLPAARVLGVTATPERLDGCGLRDVFDVLVAGPTVKELVAAGFLAPSVCYARPGAENALRSLRRVGGDYSAAAAAKLMMEGLRSPEPPSRTIAPLGTAAPHSPSVAPWPTPRPWPRPSSTPASRPPRSTAPCRPPSGMTSSPGLPAATWGC